MKLADLHHIRSLDFDIPNRRLTVFHEGSYDEISSRLEGLQFGTSIVDSTISDQTTFDEDQSKQRRLLWQVLSINFFFFGLEVLAGFLAGSMGLVADSLDMLADSIVYGLALLAVGGAVHKKKSIATASGFIQMTLAIGGIIEVVRRFWGDESLPAFQSMIVISLLALIGNATCLYLLQKSKSQEAHMKASMIFTSSDVIVNVGVIVAGVLVFMTGSKFPDLAVGAVVFIIVGRASIKILKLAR